jgi:DNA repair exonuclease SbcCD nuclease subunit
LKFVHAADIHLDSPLRGLDRYEGAPVDAMRGATRRALTNLVDLCIDEGVDFLLIAGDLYDGGWKDYHTGLCFAAEMSRLRAANIPVVLVRGNHDAQSQITRSLRLPDNVRELACKRPETYEIPDLGVAVHGQGFASRAVTEDLSASYPNPIAGLFNIGLLHTCAEGRTGHEAYAPCTVGALRTKGYDYWALGHVHAREVLSREPWVVFPGNLQGRHVRETGPKGATLINVERGSITTVEHRPLDVVRWGVCPVDVSEATNADDVLESTRSALESALADAEGRPLAARVIVQGATQVHAALEADLSKWVSEIRAMATDLGGVWVEKVVLSTRSTLDLEALREREDAMGDLVRVLQDLRGDEEGLRGLLGELKDLRAKLPPELREGDEALRLEDPAEVQAVLGDVEQILLTRLLHKEVAS